MIENRRLILVVLLASFIALSVEHPLQEEPAAPIIAPNPAPPTIPNPEAPLPSALPSNPTPELPVLNDKPIPVERKDDNVEEDLILAPSEDAVGDKTDLETANTFWGGYGGGWGGYYRRPYYSGWRSGYGGWGGRGFGGWGYGGGWGRGWGGRHYWG